jgi:hypothetical protein
VRLELPDELEPGTSALDGAGEAPVIRARHGRPGEESLSGRPEDESLRVESGRERREPSPAGELPLV